MTSETVGTSGNGSGPPPLEAPKKEKGAAGTKARKATGGTKPGFCPECGAYVGAFYRCTVCRAKMPHGNRLRATQAAVLVATVLGLYLLGGYARVDPAPLVDIGDVGVTYSNGLVTVNGTVTNIDFRQASDGSWRTLIFSVTDDTGTIDVKAYTEVVDEMIATFNTPAMGDRCSVRGSVYVKGDDKYLLLEASRYFVPTRPVVVEANATTLYQNLVVTGAWNLSEYLGQRVRVNGTISRVADDGSYFDLDYDVRVYLPDYVRQFAPNQTLSVVKGDLVEVVGVLDLYYGTLEVLPGSVRDVEIIAHGGAQP